MLYHYKEIRRLYKILSTLIKYGFGGLVSQLKILPFATLLQRVLFFRRSGRGKSVPERIRLVLEELGPTFIKLGQVASTRADVLPRDWVTEFKKLQDMVPAAPFPEIEKVLERSLGGPISDHFSSFDETPVASASIAQVHFATLTSGEKVAVKVKRPGIGRVIDADISVMRTLAELLVRYVPTARRYRPLAVVDEFSRIITKEQDMTIEASNITRFNEIFKDDERIQIPHVYWEHTGAEVLTMERIYGVPMDEIDKIKEKNLDIKEISIAGIELFFKQVFEHGVFHADLHPGNIFVRDDGVLIYLDFGIVGRLDYKLRRYLASMLYYIVKQDYHKLTQMHLEMGLISKDVDLAEFEDALRDIAEPIFGRDLSDINVSGLLMQLINTARRFQMVLQPNLLLLQKSMVIIEGVGRQLYPDINVWEVAKPLVYKWMIKEKLSPKNAFKETTDSAKDLIDTMVDLPRQAGSFFERAASDNLRIGFDVGKIDEITGSIEGAGRNIALGIIAAAVGLGASVTFVFAGPDATRLFGIPLLGITGYAISVVLFLMILVGGRSGDGGNGEY